MAIFNIQCVTENIILLSYIYILVINPAKQMRL